MSRKHRYQGFPLARPCIVICAADARTRSLHEAVVAGRWRSRKGPVVANPVDHV